MKFRGLGAGISADDRVADGYRADVLIAWGDPVLPGAPPFRPSALTAEAQASQFGANADYLAFLPLPRGSVRSDHGLLCVNHEFTKAVAMFDGLGDSYLSARERSTAAQAAVELQAHGHSVLEIRRDAAGAVRVVDDSVFARRVTATTPIELRGPAAGHARLRTAADPTGRLVRGTFADCAGGVTPWGTVLIAEENFDEYFWGDPEALPGADQLRRYTVGREPEYGWGRSAVEPGIDAVLRDELRRFDLQHEPNECNRFGWVVELDPYDPASRPVKRTALGRFKHESATVVVSGSGRVVVYSGDDEEFEYLYRYVSDGTVDEHAGFDSDLLDRGVLSAARFDADGTLTWLPLIFGKGGLTPDNGFADQAEVLLWARRAADIAGATPLDRPEDVEVDPRTGGVLVALTNNLARTEEQVDGANPRPRNSAGHLLELLPPGDTDALRHDAPSFRWNVFLLGGADARPGDEGADRLSAPAWAAGLRCPDNLAFDPSGRLWIATDGSPTTFADDVPLARRMPDGLWAIEEDAGGARRPLLLYACPNGAELCGPCFTPDGETLFVAVQHPGGGAPFARSPTRWPAGRPGVRPLRGGPPPPRSAVVVIAKQRPDAAGDSGADDPGGFDPRIGS